MHISVTRLRLASWLTVPAFLTASDKSARQAKAAAGFVEGRLLLDHGRVFWTLTAWKNVTAMRAFRDTGLHADIMPKLAEWCDEAAVAQWQTPDGALPSWTDAHRRLIAEGRASRLNRPSARHAALDLPPPAMSRWRDQAF